MSLIVAIDTQQIVSLLIGDLSAIVQWPDSPKHLANAARRTAFSLAWAAALD
jgi:hypothetical protein